MKTLSKEVYAKFRLSIDNGFRNEFSYVDYRKWGVMETWAGCRISGTLPIRQTPDMGIEVWLNWSLYGVYKSYDEVETLIAQLLKDSSVPLNDVIHYLKIRP